MLGGGWRGNANDHMRQDRGPQPRGRARCLGASRAWIGAGMGTAWQAAQTG